MLTGKAIICLSAVDWSGAIWARPQQLMSRFAQTNPVLYVDPPITYLSPLKNPALWRRISAVRREPRPAGDNVLVWTPPVFLPFGSRCRAINRINQRLLAGQLRPVLARLGFNRPVLWTYLPQTADLLDRLPADLLCYDCVDEHAAFPGFSPSIVQAMEDELLRKADVVFASAGTLYEAKKAMAPSIRLLPNAADVEHFRPERTADLPCPPELAGMEGPVLGFVGGVHEWVDLDLIRSVAQMRPDWNFVFIGPVSTATDRLQALPNVRFLGSRPYREVPAYVKHFTVGLIPFKINELTHKVNPVKLYEYLAAGKPVVATPLPELKSFADITYLAANPEGFRATVEQALREDGPELRQRRFRAAEANSWDSRCREMVGYLAAALESRTVREKPL